MLDGGDFIRVAVGAVSEDVPLSNIKSVESTTQVRLTVAEIRLKVPGRLGREIVFFPLPRRNADGQNEVVANLRERIAKASAHAI